MSLTLRNLTLRGAAIALGSVLSAGVAHAQDTTSAATPPPTAPVDTGGDTVTIGAGAAIVPTYEGSDRSRIIPFGAVRGTVSGYAFSTRGTQLFVDIVRNQSGPTIDFQLGPVASLNLNRITKTRDPQVDALGRKKIALELGGYAGIAKTGVITSQYDKLGVSVTYVHDVSGVHDSYVWTPQIDYGAPLSRKVYVAISANANYAGGGYARSYFGINGAQSFLSGLPVYTARKGWKNYSISGLVNYSISGDLLGGWSVVGGLSYSRLLNDFADSPIVSQVGDRNQLFGALGIAYTF